MMQTRERARTRLRLRFATAALLAAAAAACSKSDGGTAPSANANPNAKEIDIHPAAHDAQFSSPFDATPDPEGKVVYFTAMTADGPAVFRAAVAGGELTRLFVGEPLVTPFAIAISDDGSQLFVADAAAESETDEKGAIFVMPASGGAPSVVAGTQGTAPRGLEAMGDTVYFSGTKDGAPTVFSMPLAGGPTALASGDPLRDPSGLAVAKSGAVYVLDATAGESGTASVLAIQGGKVDVILGDIRVGFPGGIALGANDATILVSALDDGTDRDVVHVVDLATRAVTPFTKTVDRFSDPAGLHRARRAPVFAWADSRAEGSGTVFVLE
jgi:DNA-binding beta-propeller fold protein YncE